MKEVFVEQISVQLIIQRFLYTCSFKIGALSFKRFYSLPTSLSEGVAGLAQRYRTYLLSPRFAGSIPSLDPCTASLSVPFCGAMLKWFGSARKRLPFHMTAVVLMQIEPS